MFKKTFGYGFAFVLFLFMTPVFAHHGAHLGKINFTTSGNYAAQPYFERGVMWLHSFEYQEARTDFQQAQKIDPNFVMAYWGEAMTYNHPLWIEQDRKAALQVLNKLAPTPATRLLKAKTAKEKAYISAIDLLYGNGNKQQRDDAYLNAMRQLYQENPNDDEVASFYALALLGATEGQRDFGSYMQAAGIAEEIYSRNPRHPGALHYVIHSYDDPVHAPLGLRAARTYAKMAPDASHALHMPSHIYFALGMWNDVMASNKSAWEAGIKQNTTKDPKAFTVDDLHALHWLSYGYLQTKQYLKAYQLTKKMEQIAEHANSPMSKWYYALMRAAYITESNDWRADLKSLDMTNIELSAHASDLYTNAIIALRNNDIKSVDSALKKLLQLICQSPNPQDTESNYFTATLPSGITATKIMVLELQGQIKLSKGKVDEAIKLLKAAMQLENQMSFGYGPPIPIKPTDEFLAEILLKNKQYKEAYENYIFVLKRMPHRYYSEQGLKIATEKLKAAGLPIPAGIKPYFHKLMKPDFYQ